MFSRIKKVGQSGSVPVCPTLGQFEKAGFFGGLECDVDEWSENQTEYAAEHVTEIHGKNRRQRSKADGVPQHFWFDDASEDEKNDRQHE